MTPNWQRLAGSVAIQPKPFILSLRKKPTLGDYTICMAMSPSCAETGMENILQIR
jgi:hypothetical protein